MEDQIRNFRGQLAWQPTVINPFESKASKFIVCGMGGSALAAHLLKAARPKLDLLIHRDYGLPRVPDYFLRDSLLILCSYSGQTEETLDAGREALKSGLRLAALASGGKLLDWAKRNNLPHVALPAGLQPRMALGYFLKALAALQRDENLSASLSAAVVSPALLEAPSENLAEKLLGKIPMIYASTVNFPLAYHWKIMLNETAKVPAFANMLPELNHNEMQGFAAGEANPSFIFLRDAADDPRITKRMEVLKKLYEEKNLLVEAIELVGATVWAKIFHSVILANWTALHLARLNQRDPESVPLIEEFKKLL